MNAGVYARHKDMASAPLAASGLHTGAQCQKEDKFSFLPCLLSPSLVAILGLCPAVQEKLLWARAFFGIDTSVFRYNKITFDFMSKTLILHSDILCYFIYCLQS